MKFENYIKKVDWLAPDITLNVGGASGVKTILGSLITLLAVGCFIGSTIVSMQTFFSTDNPTVISQVSSSIVYPPINLEENFMVPRILPLSGTATPLPPTEVPKFATFLLNVVTTKVTIGTDGSFTSGAEVKTYPYVPCALLAQAGKLDIPKLNRTMRGFVHLFLQVGICPDYPESELTVSGRATDSSFVAMQFVVLPCSLPDPAQCATKAQLKNFQFAYLTGQDSVNLGNFEAPLEFSVSADELYYLDLGIVNRVSSRLLEIEIWDSRNLLFTPDTLRTKYAKVETQFTTPASRDSNKVSCSLMEIKTNTCDPYFVRIVQSGGSKQTITRSYKGLVETLGDVGGSRDTIFTIALLLYIFFNERSKKKYLLKAVYGIESEYKGPGKEDPAVSKQRQELQEKAFDHIEETLDVLAILKELNQLRMLTNFLLGPELQDKAPASILSKVYEQHKAEEKLTQKNKTFSPQQVFPVALETEKSSPNKQVVPGRKLQAKKVSTQARPDGDKIDDPLTTGTWDVQVVDKLQRELAAKIEESLEESKDTLEVVLQQKHMQPQPAESGGSFNQRTTIQTRTTVAASVVIAERMGEERKPLK